MAFATVDVHDGIPVVEHRHPVGCAQCGTDRGPFRAPSIVACQFNDLRVCLVAQRHGEFGWRTGPLAFLHRDRHRRRICRRSRAERRLRTPPAARDDDHGHVYRHTAGRLPRRADRGGAAAAVRLGGDLHSGWLVPTRSSAGIGAVAAGIAAVPGRPAGAASAPCRPAWAPGHRAGRRRSGRYSNGQSGRHAVQQRLRAADDTAVGHLLLQPAQPVPVRLLAADRAEPDRNDSVSGGFRLKPARLWRGVCGAVPRHGDRPDRA